MTITLMWYHIPALLSVLALVVAIWWPSKQDYGMFAGLALLMRLIPAFMFICVVWIVTASVRN